MMGIVLGSLIPGQDKKYASTDGIAFSLGAVVGALPAGVVSANIGPRKAIMLFEAIVVPGWVILMVPTSAMIIAGRVIQGIGIGAMCTVVPTYIAEIAYYNVRGEFDLVHGDRFESKVPNLWLTGLSGGGGELLKLKMFNYCILRKL